MSRLDVLKKLESTLEHFLTRAVEIEEGQIEAHTSIDTLDDIARESLRGRTISSQLGNWFARNRNRLESGRFPNSELDSIANLLGEIRSGLDRSDPETKKLADEIDHWRDKGVIPKRKLILKMKPKTDQSNLFKEFAGILDREVNLLGSGELGNRHLLTILDDILKSAEAKQDLMYLHLAGSMMYYLKMAGYKISPFVTRLKDIERERIGDRNAE